ncbi:hypothetical protein BRADI_4g01935v3 [Brachypodium distachyon]|uniref:Uncharacterized protein n=1 Tax=Brachypodium distachyon TaxID=15368 RepID=A0A0Q3EHR0_BRADI|nr:hypothetical protein BRADI_4g01935v3 [Brachypodium distachyon]
MSSDFSTTTTSKVGQIRRMPPSRWEGTAATVERRRCKKKLRKAMDTLSSPS